MDRYIDDLLKTLENCRRNGDCAIALLGDTRAEGWAPLALAQLLKEGWLRWAVLDRYDLRWLNACVLNGVVPAVYDLPAGAVPPNDTGPALLFRHGQQDSAASLHGKQAPSLWQGLKSPAVIIDFLGVGSETGLPQGSHIVFEVGAENAPRVPSSNLHPLPLMPPEQLLVAMGRGLSAFPPDLLRYPMSAVQDCIAQLPPLTLGAGAVQLTPAEPLQRIISDVADLCHGGQGQLRPPDRRRLWLQYGVQHALLAGDYDAAESALAEAMEDSGDDKGRQLLVWCLLEQADGLCLDAEKYTDVVAGQYYARAGELYRRVLELMPDHFEACVKWADALKSQGETDSASAAKCFRAAAEKYQAALAMRQDHTVLYNWGCVLQKLAEMQSADSALPLFREATEKFAQVLQQEPGFHQALWQWGEAIRSQAMGKRGAEAEDMCRQAEEKFAAAAALQPNDGAMLNRWGVLLLELANRAMGDQRRTLLDEAARRFQHAERLQPGLAAYDLACLASLRRDEAETRMWLLKAKELGSLPSAEHVINDPDLDWLRQAPWLKELLAGWLR